MNHKLSIDEYDALEQLSKLPRNTKPSACISRNAKKLSGIKLMNFRKDGGLELTDAGKQVLFIKQCIDGLRAIAENSESMPGNAVISFLSKKAHIEINAESGKLEITQRGRECLDDIDKHVLKK